jgi:hypothetical protein
VKNPLGIHCTICTPSQPCSRCLVQVQAEAEWLREHMKTCEKPLPLCSPCGGAFGLKP